MSFSVIERKGEDRLILAIRLEVRSVTMRLPEPMVGAIVTAFSFAEGPSEAAAKSSSAAEKKGVLVKGLAGGFSIPVHQFRAFVEQQWPEFADQMPLQSEIARHLGAGEVVFGPLIGFERD